MYHRFAKLGAAGLAAGLWPLGLLLIGNPTFSLHDFALTLPLLLGATATFLGEKLHLRSLTLFSAAVLGGYISLLPIPFLPLPLAGLRSDTLPAMVCLLTIFGISLCYTRPHWLLVFPTLAEVFVIAVFFSVAPRLMPEATWMVRAWTYRVSVPMLGLPFLLEWLNGAAVLATGLLLFRSWKTEVPAAALLPVLTLLALGCFWLMDTLYLKGLQDSIPTDLFVSVPALSAVSFLVFGELYLYWQRIYLDELTGVLNRRALNERLWNLRPHYSRHHYTLAMIDIDHFKRFNDTFGHEQGDTVLRFVAAHFKNPQHGTFYRFGGEEFCIVFENISAPHAARILNQMREDLAQKTFHIRASKQVRAQTSRKDRKSAPKTSKINITVSIGLAEPQADAQTADDVLKAADAALYRAKHMGRNRVVESSPTETNFVAQLSKS
jgi:diguanylate cyclase (GGDEF)-like protein